MAKLTSKDLEKRADEVSGKLEAHRIKNAEMVLDGKVDQSSLNEISNLEKELSSTKDAIILARQREAEEAERLKIQQQEAAKSEAGRIRNQAIEKLETVLDELVNLVYSTDEFLGLLQKGADVMSRADLTGKVMNDSEYYEVISEVLRMARGLSEAYPHRAFPGHENIKAELNPILNKYRTRY